MQANTAASFLSAPFPADEVMWDCLLGLPCLLSTVRLPGLPALTEYGVPRAHSLHWPSHRQLLVALRPTCDIGHRRPRSAAVTSSLLWWPGLLERPPVCPCPSCACLPGEGGTLTHRDRALSTSPRVHPSLLETSE